MKIPEIYANSMKTALCEKCKNEFQYISIKTHKKPRFCSKCAKEKMS